MQLREKFRPVLNNYDQRNEIEVANAIKSLIELHRTIERYLTGNPQPEVAQQMLRAVAQQSCEWVRLMQKSVSYRI